MSRPQDLLGAVIARDDKIAHTEVFDRDIAPKGLDQGAACITDDTGIFRVHIAGADGAAIDRHIVGTSCTEAIVLIGEGEAFDLGEGRRVWALREAAFFVC